MFFLVHLLLLEITYDRSASWDTTKCATNGCEDSCLSHDQKWYVFLSLFPFYCVILWPQDVLPALERKERFPPFPGGSWVAGAKS
jgi:hypothetical protein